MSDLIQKNTAFAWVAAGTVAMLLVPLLAMQFTADVRWGAADFIIMGSLLFAMGSLFVLVARKAPRKHRLIIGGLFILVFLYIWVELAVGLFTNLGS